MEGGRGKREWGVYGFFSLLLIMHQRHDTHSSQCCSEEGQFGCGGHLDASVHIADKT